MGSSMFRGADNKVSMMRVSSFIVVTCVMAVFVGHNVLAMIHGGGFVSIGYEEAGLISLVLGAKAYQMYGENRTNGNGNGNGKCAVKTTTTTDLPSDKKE